MIEGYIPTQEERSKFMEAVPLFLEGTDNKIVRAGAMDFMLSFRTGESNYITTNSYDLVNGTFVKTQGFTDRRSIKNGTVNLSFVGNHFDYIEG